MVSRPLDFVVIGAAKSGTTSLFHHLRGHERLFMPAAKEAPFFSKDPVYLRGWDAYLAEHFGDAAPDRLWGTITPRYLGDLHVPERMHRDLPDARLLALLRNPVDRAFSKHQMQVRSGSETRSFDQLVDDQLAPAALAESRATTVSMGDAVLVRGEYGRLLQTYLDHYRRDQLCVMFTDDLERDPGVVIDAALAHLGLDPGWRPDDLDRRYFEGGARQRFPRLTQAAGRSSALSRVWRAVPASRRQSLRWWYRAEVNVARDGGERERMSAETRARLVDLYRPDVAVLEAIVGAPVPWAELRTEGSTP